MALIYATATAIAMLWLSPRVPYADTWRFDAQLLAQPFPINVLMVDNGHAQILPRLLRWLELGLWHGTQGPTIIAGMLLLATALLLWSSAGLAATSADNHRVRAAWLLTGVVGLCWLGNARTLTHGNEAIHSYLIVACLLGALRLALKPGAARLTAALALGVLASLSFGTGIAVFPAIAWALLVRRADARALAACCAAAVLAIVLYLILPRAMGGTGVIVLQPGLQLAQLARWLGSPWLLAGGPLVDASVVDKLPAAAQPLARPFAALSTAVFGPARTALWPELGLGLAGMMVLVWLSWGTWKQARRAESAQVLATGCAWFALGCGVLVVLARSTAFIHDPEQIYASRYAVWYTLFWCGLLGAMLWRLHAAGRSMAAPVLSLIVATALLPATGWSIYRAMHMDRIAASDALALRVGVFDRNGDHGENRLEDMRRARSELLARRTSIFAPAHGPLAGTRLKPPLPMQPLRQLSWQPVANAFGPAAARLEFTLEDLSVNHLYLVSNNTIIGEAGRAPASGRWQGWALGSERPATLHAVSRGDAMTHATSSTEPSRQ